MKNDSPVIIEAKGIRKDFLRQGKGSNIFPAVKETDLILRAGAFVVLKGRSGSGKTTLLNMLAGLLTPGAGRVLFYDTQTDSATSLYETDEEALARLRNRYFGYVPQGNSAVGSLSVMENIVLPKALYGDNPPDSGTLDALLARLSITALKDAYPASLSGGEMKRMAIARALAGKPAVIFADEPTADLDDENTRIVFDLLKEAALAGAAVLCVTHENDADAYADELLRMSDGTLLRNGNA